MIGLACATILISSLIALSQDNLKRRLAFSTIGQLGYVVLGATLATEQGVGGSVLHIAMHACGKITSSFVRVQSLLQPERSMSANCGAWVEKCQSPWVRL